MTELTRREHLLLQEDLAFVGWLAMLVVGDFMPGTHAGAVVRYWNALEKHESYRRSNADPA